MPTEKLSAAERSDARTKSFSDTRHLEEELKHARQSVEFYQRRLLVIKQALRMKSRRSSRVEA